MFVWFGLNIRHIFLLSQFLEITVITFFRWFLICKWLYILLFSFQGSFVFFLCHHLTTFISILCFFFFVNIFFEIFQILNFSRLLRAFSLIYNIISNLICQLYFNIFLIQRWIKYFLFLRRILIYHLNWYSSMFF